mmetsp:Transcript_53801/g.114868  ORF Transcript_53801/g.114868 Transcript_53801/m.114868 type:complete len:580 (-) Transcript_53801:58-1797(-)
MANANGPVPFPSHVESADWTLLEMVRSLYRLGGLEAIETFFKRELYGCKVKQYDEVADGGPSQRIGSFATVTVKYIDGLNRLWQPRWAIEARGRSYAVLLDADPQDEAVVLELDAKLVRGPEFLTEAHHGAGVNDSQDIGFAADTSHLNRWQQEVMGQFGNSKSSLPDAVISTKVDGANGNITFYPAGSTANALIKVVNLGKMTVELEVGLFVFATSGCPYVSENMEDYVVTAMAAHFKIPVDQAAAPMQNWAREDFQTALTQFCRSLLGADAEPAQTTFIFEWVNANRRSYTGKVHVQLAANYAEAGLFFLGLSKHGVYVPHFDVQHLHHLPQPMWRRVSTAGEVFDYMHDLRAVTFGTLTEAALVDKWFPGQSGPIHVEGLVISDYHHCNKPYGPTYGKIKTPDYYLIHKWEKYTAKRVLAEFSENVDQFYPTLKKLRKFQGTSRESLLHGAKEVKAMIQAQIAEGSDTYKSLQQKAKVYFDRYFEDRQQTAAYVTCFRMAVGTMPRSVRETVAAKLASELQIDVGMHADKLMSLLGKPFLLNCQGWEDDGYEARVGNYLDQHPELQPLLLNMYLNS